MLILRTRALHNKHPLEMYVDINLSNDTWHYCLDAFMLGILGRFYLHISLDVCEQLHVGNCISIVLV